MEGTKQNVLTREFGFFLSMPKMARTACNCLLIALVMKGILLAFIVGMMVSGRIPDRTGWIIGVVGFVFLSYLCVCTSMAIKRLSQGQRSGRVWAWLVLPFLLPGFPMMTLVAVYTIVSLHSSEMEEYIRQRESG